MLVSSLSSFVLYAFFFQSNRHAYMCFEKGDGDILANCVEYGTISKDVSGSLLGLFCTCPHGQAGIRMIFCQMSTH